MPPINLSRRSFLLLSSLGTAALLSGCITGEMLNDKYDDYAEEVSSVLLSADGKYLVFIGGKYHYIFTAPAVLVKTLGSSFQKSVTAEIGTFEIDKKQHAAGNILLTLSEDASEEAKQAAMQAGYSLDKNNKLACSTSLSGTRYKSNDIDKALTSQKLNKKYHVHVITRESTSKTAAKLLVSPITATLDGALVIAGIPLVIIGLSMFIGACALYPGCRL